MLVSTEEEQNELTKLDFVLSFDCFLGVLLLFSSPAVGVWALEPSLPPLSSWPFLGDAMRASVFMGSAAG